ncbi:MAG TPA: transcriptional repressor, partial [Bacteroidetes bacterium]|nr:transcriptional repressor [Bacteroidota bacterium]
ILAVMHEKKTHPTAEEVFTEVRRRLPNISLATVYRNLDLLVEENRIRRLESGNGPRRYDGDLSHHYHIRCVRCGAVEDVSVDRIPDLVSQVRRTGGYHILGMKLEFTGLCEMCRKAGDGSAGEESGGDGGSE